MNSLKYIILSCFAVISCHSQNTGPVDSVIGGPCQGCEAILEKDSKLLSSVDTLEGFLENDPKMKVEGTIFELDGKTPASDIILYVYQTNRKGLYESSEDAKGWGRTHGMHRGWVKTDKDGKYSFYTFRPAAYPSGTEAEHIHMIVKEPGKNEYYIDSVVFDDDPKLTEDRRAKLLNRGGSGITIPKMNNGMVQIKKDIILGKNIPNYQ